MFIISREMQTYTQQVYDFHQKFKGIILKFIFEYVFIF